MNAFVPASANSLTQYLYSVFDLMYQEYTKERLEFLQKHRKISQYDSENLMYAALTGLLESMPDLGLKVACHQSLRLLFRDYFRMTEEERHYASRPGTHVDFLLYNPVSKEPVLAIEVDGFNFHKDGTKQAQRDRMKDSIFEKYGIPMLRLPTNGSGEVEKVRRFLEKDEPHTPEKLKMSNALTITECVIVRAFFLYDALVRYSADGRIMLSKTAFAFCISFAEKAQSFTSTG